MAELHPDSIPVALENLTLTTPQTVSLGLRYLPIELQDMIVTFLDQESLFSLALTCRSTKASAMRIIYASYVNRDAPSKAPFHTFLRTLCESPELAAMVKVIDIRGWRSEFEVATGLPWAGVTRARAVDKLRPRRKGPLFISSSKSTIRTSKTQELFEETAVRIGLIAPPLSSSVPALRKSVRAGASLKQDDDFVRLLRNNVEDAHLVLILALMPNLQRLRIDGMSTHPTLDLSHFLERSTSAPRFLHELCIYGNQPADERTYHSTNLALLRLNSGLQVLTLSHISLEAPSQLDGILSGKKLRKFTAVQCKVDPKMLRAIISGQRLTDFRYKPTLQDVPKKDAALSTEDHIVDNLSSALDSLEKLCLYSARTSKSPRFSECRKLEVLEMPFQYGFLDGNQGNAQSITTAFRKRIPSSLSTLIFRCVHPSQEIYDSMEILADLKLQGEFPALEMVRLNFCQWFMASWLPPVPYEDLRPEAAEVLGGLLEKAGLTLAVAQTD